MSTNVSSQILKNSSSLYKGPKHYLKIRLARWGARNNPFYGIVVAVRTSPRDGRHVDRVGTYNPVPVPDPMEYQKFLLEKGPGRNKNVNYPAKTMKHLELNVEKIKHWLGNGAQPTEKVAWLLAKAGIMPYTPRQQHKLGQISLNDKETWDLVIKNEKGEILALIPKEEVNFDQDGSKLEIEKFTQITRKLIDNNSSIRNHGSMSEEVKDELRMLSLDGRLPKRPLTDAERLFALQSKYIQ